MVRQAAKQAAEAGVKNARCGALAAGAGICALHLRISLHMLLLSTLTMQDNVIPCSFEVADAEDLGAYADGTFDVLTCNCGIMFMPHYSK